MVNGNQNSAPTDTQVILDLLIGFGYDTHVALAVANDARRNHLTPANVAAWIDEALTSTTLSNPRGFVRARIRDGHQPPQPLDRLRQAHASRQRYRGWGICPNCQARPCLCEWDAEKESLTQFKARTYPAPRRNNHGK